MRLQLLLVISALAAFNFLNGQTVSPVSAGMRTATTTGPDVDKPETAALQMTDWQPPAGVSVHKKAWKLKPSDDKWCSTLIGLDFFADHLANYIVVRKDSIFLRHDDLESMKGILRKGKDGFAVDIVDRKQFPCDADNDLHKSFAHDGVLLKPVFRNKLLKKNKLEDSGQFEAFLGRIPAGMKNRDDLQYNVLTIKHKCVCRYSTLLEPMTGGLNLVEVDIPWDTVGFAPIERNIRRYLDFVVPFEKEKFVYKVEDVQPLLDSVHALGRIITRIDIKAYASVEGTKTLNMDLYNRRAEGIYDAIQSQQQQPIMLSRQAYENWSDFRVDVLNTPYAWLLGMNREQIKDTMSANSKIWKDLEPTLAPHRKAEVRVFLSESFLDTLAPKQVLRQYKRSMEQGMPDSAIYYQSILLRSFESGQLQREVLLRTDIPIRKGMSTLHANRFNMARKIGDPDYINWYIRKADSILSFNHDSPTLTALYMDWRIRNLHAAPGTYKRLPFEYTQNLDRIERQGYPIDLINRMRLNFHLAGVTWAESHEDLAARESSLKSIYGLLKPARLNDEELSKMGRFFNAYFRVRWTVDMLKPRIESGDYPEELMLVYLSSAMFYPEVAGEDNLKILTLKARDMNKNWFCSRSRMYFQMRRLEWMKPILCDSCGE